jgi:hypothetical protein
MKPRHHLLSCAALAVAALAALPAHAGVNVGVSIGLNQPGLWGSVNIGPIHVVPPVVVTPPGWAPVPPRVVIVPAPGYRWVPPPAVVVPPPTYRWVPPPAALPAPAQRWVPPHRPRENHRPCRPWGGACDGSQYVVYRA